MSIDRTVVLGIGNTILSDEGLGVVAVERLRQMYTFEPEIELIDGGTIGIDLINFIEGTDRLLVLDAVLGGKEPGTLYHFEGEQVKKYFRNKVSMHEIGFQEVMALMDLREKAPREIVIMGIEPKFIELGTELSAEVEENMNKLLDMVVEKLSLWGFNVLEKAGKEV